MVGWFHRCNGHAFEQAPGDGEGQGSLACCSPKGLKELDMSERLNNNITGQDASTAGQESTQILWGVSRLERRVHPQVVSSRHFAIYQQKQTPPKTLLKA